LVTQSLQGELATPIMNLIEKRDNNLQALTNLRNSLNGVSTDVVFGPPDLPTVPSWPKKAIITILAVVVSALLFLVFVILRRSCSG
jgi:LPS O-antigen subunit length determinant protein (WzzB/FepE family)